MNKITRYNGSRRFENQLADFGSFWNGILGTHLNIWVGVPSYLAVKLFHFVLQRLLLLTPIILSAQLELRKKENAPLQVKWESI